MLTGSMSPGINPGDVVVTSPKPAAEVEVGDVISYHIPVEDHRVETHRVIKVTHEENGTIAVETKGDNNNNVDPWTAIIEGDTVWEVQAVVPKVGSCDPRAPRAAGPARYLLGRPRGRSPARPRRIWGQGPRESATSPPREQA